jgi:hypothetical protein
MAEPHQHRRDGDPEGQFTPTVRNESWFGRNAMAVLSVIIGLGGGVLGSWVTTQVRETRTEAALDQIKGTVSELKGGMESLGKTVNAAAVASGRLSADTDHTKSDLEREVRAREMLEARTIVNEKDIAKLQAYAGIRK